MSNYNKKLPSKAVFCYTTLIMSWSSQRKATYSISFLIIIFAIIFVIGFFFFYKKPTCSDSILNQGEEGIDCGGPCARLCRQAYNDPTIQWIRWQKNASTGSYNIIAYVNNPNVGVAAYADYNYKIYDKDGLLLYSGNGNSFIPSEIYSVLFIDNVGIGDKVPARVTITISKNLSWQNYSSNTVLTVTDKQLIDEDIKPKLTATLKNSGLNAIRNIEPVAILYDQNGNSVAFSKTFVDEIAPGKTTEIIYTWPQVFKEKIYKIEIISKILP